MYIIDQKVGKHIYVYEVHSYWDKQKKSPRQQRIRIGKRDPHTGEFIQFKSKRRSREYGPVYFLAALIEQLGLKVLLKEELPEIAREIVLAACFQIAEHKPFYLCNSWLERIYLAEPFSLTSQRLSRLLHKLGESEQEIYRFLDAWTESRAESEFIVFDITSISTYSQQIDFAEWGYNRDGDKLTQVNYGVVYGEPSNLPLLYSLYPGSVPDVVTLTNIKKRLERISKLRTLFVLDRGFYSTKNLEQLISLGQFIIPLPIRIKAAKELVDIHRSHIGDTENAFQMGRGLLYSVTDEVQITESTLTAHLYFNEKQSSEDREKLLLFLLTVEQEVSRKQWNTPVKLIRFLDDNWSAWQQYFSIGQTDTGHTVFRKKEAIDLASQRHGLFVLLTNADISAEQTLTYYRRRDGVEKLFDLMKHGIDQKRLRVHSRQSVEGLLFINFISLILYSEIQHTLRESGLGKKLTVEQFFFELKKLSVIEIDERKPMITELTRKQKEIFNAFEIPLPVTT